MWNNCSPSQTGGFVSGPTLRASLPLLWLSALLVGCSGGGGDTGGGVGGGGTTLYSVGGTISGLSGTVVLRNGGGDNLSRSANGAFNFGTRLASGSSYAVTVLTQPGGQTCTVTGGAGTVGSANVSNVTVTCVDTPDAAKNANLTALALSVGALEQTFQSGLLAYTSTQAYPVTSLTVTPTAAAAGATIRVNGTTVTSGNPSPSIAIAESGATLIQIVVTSADASSTVTYALSVSRQSAGAFAQEAYIKASNTEALDQFGVSVAVAGNTLVVGTPFEDSRASGVNGDQTDNGMFSSGAAYVFVRNGTTWVQQAYLKASSNQASAHFGHSVAVQNDTIVVGAPQENGGSIADPDDESVRSSGAVYVFQRNGTSWGQPVRLQASNAGVNDEFGWSVALSGDLLAISAYSEASGVPGNPDDNSAPQAGAVYVFERNDASWTQQAYLKAAHPDTLDQFGASIALYGDTLAVGAPFESSAAIGINGDATDNSANSSGAVYVFERNGTTWAQQAYLKASNSQALDLFGSSVALDMAGLAVGAPYESSAATGVGGNQADNNATRSGAVYVFNSDGTSWTQRAYIKASNTGANDGFGGSVALSSGMLAVGARYEQGRSAGVDGNQADDGNDWNGAVYVYRFNGTTWTPEHYVKASNTGAGDQFGISIAASGGTLAVGAINEDSAATGVGGDQADNSAERSGAVYVFTGPAPT